MTGTHAQIRTDHGDATTARRVAAAVRPDNTDEMDTRTDGQTVVTTVRRETTGGLHSTVDDYVVNVEVATQLASRTGTPADAGSPATPTDDTNTDT